MTDDEYRYYLSVSLRESKILQELREEMEKHDFGDFQISPEQGQFMAFMTRLLKVKKYLEIGTFTGYSSLAVAEAMPADGKVITCDVRPEWTDVAKRFWEKGGVSDKIELRLGEAIETLDGMIKDGLQETFDMAFIDADKMNHDTYYEFCLRLVKSDGLIILDNVFRHRKVMKASRDEVTTAVHELNEKIHDDERVDVSMLPISDGLYLIRKK